MGGLGVLNLVPLKIKHNHTQTNYKEFYMQSTKILARPYRNRVQKYLLMNFKIKNQDIPGTGKLQLSVSSIISLFPRKREQMEGI